MIKRDGHYILTTADYSFLCKVFRLSPSAVRVKEFPSVNFIEYRFIDIHTNTVLFSFFDHDGMIRIPNDNNSDTFLFELNSNDIFNKNSNNEIPDNIMKAVINNIHSHSTNIRKAQNRSLK